MRIAIITLAACCVLASTVVAQDNTRFVERTPLPHVPPQHTMQRAGNPAAVAWYAMPSVSKFDTGGYVGGGKLLGNNIFSKGPGAATGPLTSGTFGSDFAGFKLRPGRVFLAMSPDPSRGPAVANGYRTDGPPVPDVFALRPFRKAVLEKKEDTTERKHAGDRR